MHTQRSENWTGEMKSRWHQHGAILPLFAVGMLAILVMAGLALDMSHLLLNKTRLQNSVDAAALAGAEVMHQGTGQISDAEAMARAIFFANATGEGNWEMAADVEDSEVFVEFSTGLKPFNPGAGQATAEYVRVRVENFTMRAWLIGLLGIDTKVARASAVAGPSPTLEAPCTLVPLIVCGDTDPVTGGAPYWGFEPGYLQVLKSGSKNGTSSGDIGPGNFQLGRLGGPGCDIARENLAGGYKECALLGPTIPTQPGNCAGPVRQGINTRFGQYQGGVKPEDGAPDVIVQEQEPGLTVFEGVKDDPSDDAILLDGVPVELASELDFDYEEYNRRLRVPDLDNTPKEDGGNAEYNRRELPVIVADCADGEANGQNDLPILGLGCFFLLQPVEKNGTENIVYGEFVDECPGQGVVGPDPDVVPGPFIIQLYKDSASIDS